MFSIEIYNNETLTTENTLTFETKRKANKFLKDNTEKRGYDFYSKENRSIEYKKQY